MYVFEGCMCSRSVCVPRRSVAHLFVAHHGSSGQTRRLQMHQLRHRGAVELGCSSSSGGSGSGGSGGGGEGVSASGR